MSETNSTQLTAQINYNVNDINSLLSIINNNKDIITIPIETSEVKANEVSTNELSANSFIGGQVTATAGFSSSALSFLASIETNSLKINSNNAQIDVKHSLDSINDSIHSLSADLGSSVNEYLQSEEAQDIIVSATENTVDTKINTALNDYSLTTEIENMISNAITIAKKDFLDSAYPIGSIYMSMDLKNPATLFGGEWAQVSEKFLFGASSLLESGTVNEEAKYKVSSDGSTDSGEEKVALTVNEMPRHNHAHASIGLGNDWNGGTNITVSSATALEYANWSTTSTGGGAAHNNMPPYTIVYIWKRTA